MSESNKKDNIVSSDNIFRIADELVHQVDMTKRMVLIMIVAVIVAVPVSWHIAALVKGTTFVVVGYAAIATAILFLTIGIRQWRMLSKWTKRYKAYKVMQKKVDEQLDFDEDNSDL
ncbi:MAG: hypothetical protein JRN20_11665 [Nitrososphaerota archaeon]|jgi:uncharacterized membrane protein|nr:hypothetical protein [Nitrososphaerota archaeon]MDG6923213.1 hypothetical protein [Nitrososphaerota archaeon]